MTIFTVNLIFNTSVVIFFCRRKEGGGSPNILGKNNQHLERQPSGKQSLERL